ncbi:MAG: 2Fe-2S iron-sulfur cluster-binding protein, partial [Spirochaetia bacterium]
MTVHFTLNGESKEMEAKASDLLVDLLRLKLGLRGARPGCLLGQCSSCTVLFNGSLAPSCLIPAFKVHGSEIVTIEGLMQTREYQDIERGFARAGVQPCRFCAAGKFLSIHALLSLSPNPTDHAIQDTL